MKGLIFVPATLVSKMPSPAPIPKSYWVLPGVLLAGEYPYATRPSLARQKLRALLDAGIRSFLDLTDTEDGLLPYDSSVMALAAECGCKVKYQRLSIRDLGVPSADQMLAMLEHINTEIAAARPLYVHCWGGVGRTGTVVGCWMIAKQGVSAERAIELIQELRSGIPGARRSPETLEQDRFLAEWETTYRRAHMSFTERCDTLLRFAPMFDSVFARNNERSPQIRAGAFDDAPWFGEFVQAVYDAGWWVPFDWPSWQDEARRYVDDATLIETADADILTKLLTTHVRANRFNEGHLGEMAAQGHLQAILRRVQQLRDEQT